MNIPVENTHLPNGMEPDSQKECKRYTCLLYTSIEESDNKSMPIFVNYGVNRIVLDVPVRATKEQFVKLDAFDKAIESTIDFRNLFKWFSDVYKRQVRILHL